MSILELNDDAEQIIIKVTSDKFSVGLTNFDENIEYYRESQPPEIKYTTDITIEAFAVDDFGGKVMDVGFLKAVYFESEIFFCEEISFVMLCDAISSDACGMAEAITDKRGKIKPSICHNEHNLMYIKELFIEGKCRGHGVGKYLLDNLLPLLSHSLRLRPHVCILSPYPQEKMEYGGLRDAADAPADLPRLIKFYENAGYTKLKGSEYMYQKFTSCLDELLVMAKS